MGAGSSAQQKHVRRRRPSAGTTVRVSPRYRSSSVGSEISVGTAGFRSPDVGLLSPQSFRTPGSETPHLPSSLSRLPVVKEDKLFRKSSSFFVLGKSKGPDESDDIETKSDGVGLMESPMTDFGTETTPMLGSPLGTTPIVASIADEDSEYLGVFDTGVEQSDEYMDHTGRPVSANTFTLRISRWWSILRDFVHSGEFKKSTDLTSDLTDWGTLGRKVHHDASKVFPLLKTPGEVWKLEVHFFYPFTLTDKGKAKFNIDSSLDGNTDRNVPPWEEHLLFSSCRKTVPVTTNDDGFWGERFGGKTKRPSFGSAPQGSEPSSEYVNGRDPDRIAEIRDEQGHRYDIVDAKVRFFDFGMGLFRFGVSARTRVDVQSVLTIISSIKKLRSARKSSNALFLILTFGKCNWLDHYNAGRIKVVKAILRKALLNKLNTEGYRVLPGAIRSISVHKFEKAKLTVTISFYESIRGIITLEDMAELLKRSALSVHVVIDEEAKNMLSVSAYAASTGLMLINATSGKPIGAFGSNLFIEGILNRFVGTCNDPWNEKKSNFDTSDDVWIPDKYSDQLFTFTLAAVGGLNENSRRFACYKIGQQEVSTHDSVSDDNLRRFKRHINSTHSHRETGIGIWQTFNNQGAATLYFGQQKSCREIPFLSTDRIREQLSHTEIRIFGTTEPLAMFSVCENFLFKRSFCRNLEFQLKVMALSNDHDQTAVEQVRKIYSQYLSYRAQCGGDIVSTSSSAQDQYEQWLEICAVQQYEANLLATIKDMHELLSDIYNLQNQFRLDAIGIMLGFIGVATLINDIYSSYLDHQIGEYLLLPILTSVALLSIAAYIVYTQYKYAVKFKFE
eukprot:m.170556 g.170556  ORF g.170556 m.170556 type:complete len:844 (+) comp31614_c0_seq1:443-2974(+)